jgi:hypothetical protein
MGCPRIGRKVHLPDKVRNADSDADHKRVPRLKQRSTFDAYAHAVTDI